MNDVKRDQLLRAPYSVGRSSQHGPWRWTEPCTVPPAHERAEPPITSKQGAVQIAEVMIPKIADGEPEVLLGERAEDFRSGPLVLGVFQTEKNATPPSPVLRMAEQEPNGDTLAFKAYGGKIMDDCFVKRRDCLTCRLSGHAIPGFGLKEDYTKLRLTQYCRDQVSGGGCQE